MKKNEHKILKWVGITVFFLIILKYCILPGVGFFSERILSDDQVKTKSKGSNNLYKSLFCDSIRDKLKLMHVTVLKSKHSIIEYRYQNYHVTVQKIGLTSNSTLKDATRLYNSQDSISRGITYSGYVSNSVEYLYSTVNDSTSKGLYIGLNGFLINKQGYGDSIINYNVNVRHLTFKYSISEPVDFLFAVQKENMWEKKLKNINMNVLLYKKKSSLFVIVIYPNEKKTILKNSLVSEIMCLDQSKAKYYLNDTL